MGTIVTPSNCLLPINPAVSPYKVVFGKPQNNRFLFCETGLWCIFLSSLGGPKKGNVRAFWGRIQFVEFIFFPTKGF
jgi:hypothetical protein